MPTWTTKKTESSKDTMWTCACLDTQKQLDVTDWEDGLFSISITDKPYSFWHRLWRFIRYGDANYMEIMLRPEDALSLSDRLREYADKEIKK